MEMKLRKLWPLVGALCLSVSAFANSSTQNGSSTYGSSMDSSSQSGHGSYQRGTFREITPPAGPRVAHGADVFITADFIWWKASEEGLAFSGSGLNSGSASSAADVFSSPSKGKIASVGEDWAPGFKVGLGLNMGHDGWDIYAQYTWLHASDTRTQKGSNLYLPEYVPADGGPSYFSTENRGKWDLHFNVIDLELGRNFYLSQFLTMRPHIGLKGTWQDHDWKTTSKFANGFDVRVDNQQQQQTQTLTGPAQINKHYDVWGIGVRGGFNIAWYMSKCWSIYGDLSLSTLWTNYHKQTFTAKVDDTTTGNSRGLANIDNDNIYTCKYIAELELGLRWEIWFYDDNYHFAIQAGWEQQTWINWSAFNELLYGIPNDMSLQGLNLKFRFDF